MLILFDHGTPKGLARALSGHTVHTAQAKGWDTLSNGDLLKHVDRIAAAVASAKPGAYTEIEIPFEPKPRRA